MKNAENTKRELLNDEMVIEVAGGEGSDIPIVDKIADVVGSVFDTICSWF